MFAERRSVDRILLVSGDADMIPAMNHARKAGLEIGLIQLLAPARDIHDTLRQHADYARAASLP
jgi:uncharacterized LabA/DUF88 family protein